MASMTFRISLFLSIVAFVGTSYLQKHELSVQSLELKATFKCENSDYYQDLNITVSDYFHVLPNKKLKKFSATQVYGSRPLITKYTSLFKFKPLLTIDHLCGISYTDSKRNCVMRSTMHLSFDNDKPMDQINEQMITIQLARAGKREVVCGLYWED